MLIARKIIQAVLASRLARPSGANRQRRLADFLVVATFVSMIALPGLGILMGLGKPFDPVIESRKPEPLPPMPKLNFSSAPKQAIKALWFFPASFEPYFRDHHSFRNEAMRTHLWCRAHGLTTVSEEAHVNIDHHDPKPGFEHFLPSAVVGKEGWLFLSDARSIQGYRRVNPLLPEHLQRCRNNLEQKHAYLKSKGIKFLVVIAPDKGEIYPEHLPAFARGQQAPSRLDQLMDYMRQSDVPVLDLRATLLEAKKEHQVYYRTDTHWNRVGAQAACRAVLEALGHPSASREQLSQYDWVERVHEGDLRRLLGGIGDPERTLELTPRQARCTVETEGPAYGPVRMRIAKNPRGLPVKTLVLGDSFFDVLRPMFNEHYQEVRYLFCDQIEEPLPFEHIADFAPDIVIQSIVERKLYLIE